MLNEGNIAQLESLKGLFAGVLSSMVEPVVSTICMTNTWAAMQHIELNK